MTKPEATSADDVCIELRDLCVHYQLRGSSMARLLGRDTGTVKAIDGITLDVPRGSVLGLVGESGSGKTTLGRALLGLTHITSGEAVHHGADGTERRVARLSGSELRKLRTAVQMVFQDPHAALNPSMTIETAVGHPLLIHGRARKGPELRSRVAAALERVGLSPAEQFLGKYPSDLSGGQKQRAVIARAIVLDPEVLVADEPVSMLDMSVRAKILELMLELKRDLGLTYVYITHDLATAKFFCDQVAIMYLGKVVEYGPTAEIFANPRHPYTRSLLNAIPDLSAVDAPPRDLPTGEIPDAARPPVGCSFHPRCPVATPECGWEPRDLLALLERHWTAAELEKSEKQRRIVGDAPELGSSASSVVLKPAQGSVAELAAVLAEVREATSLDPLWAGVDTITQENDGLRMEFRSSREVSPQSVGSAQVACLLHTAAADPAGPGPRSDVRIAD